jgi:hypothetical protein
MFAGFHEILVVGNHDPVRHGGRDAMISRAEKGACFGERGMQTDRAGFIAAGLIDDNA